MNKKIIALLMALLLVMLSLPLGALAMPGDHDTSERYVNTANGKGLNMRDSASKQGKKLCTIPYGARVLVYDYQAGDTWALAVYEGYEGYIMIRYTTVDKPSSTPMHLDSEYGNLKPAYYIATVRPSSPAGYVHMRWAPSKSEPVQRNYYQGQQVTVLYENNTWCQIYDSENMVCGFMMKQFLTYVSPLVVGNPTVPVVGDGNVQ